MERHSSNAMFISEIPVRCTNNGEKLIQWVSNLTSGTTARDIIISILPACDPANYSLYIHIDRKKQILKDFVRIYKVVAKINQQKSCRRLLFEIQSKKRVRFADEILLQTIIQGQCISHERLASNMIETISIAKYREVSKENFHQQQEHYMKASSSIKRSSLKRIHTNIPHSSSESGISSNSSMDDVVVVPKKLILETLV